MRLKFLVAAAMLAACTAAHADTYSNFTLSGTATPEGPMPDGTTPPSGPVTGTLTVDTTTGYFQAVLQGSYYDAENGTLDVGDNYYTDSGSNGHGTAYFSLVRTRIPETSPISPRAISTSLRHSASSTPYRTATLKRSTTRSCKATSPSPQSPPASICSVQGCWG